MLGVDLSSQVDRDTVQLEAELVLIEVLTAFGTKLPFEGIDAIEPAVEKLARCFSQQCP